MDRVDRLLGPLNPNRQAAKSCPKPYKILILDASNDEGFHVCKELLKSGRFIIWGLVPNTETPVAKELARLKANIVQGTASRPGSFKELLSEIDALFIPSNVFCDGASVGPAKQLIDNCKSAGVGHIVYTSMDIVAGTEDLADRPSKDIISYLKEKYTGPAEHLDRSHIHHEHIHWTIIYPSWKFSRLLIRNLLVRMPKRNTLPSTASQNTQATASAAPSLSDRAGGLRHTPSNASRSSNQGSTTMDGEGYEWILAVPVPDETKIPGYAVEQLGEWVKSAIINHKKWRESTMHICSTRVSPSEMACVLSKVAEKPVRTLGITMEDFHSGHFKERVNEQDWARFKAVVAGGDERDENLSKKVVPHQWTFGEWAGQSKELAALVKDNVRRY